MTKKIHIEFLRILSIFLVIFNHTSTSGFQYYTTLDFSFYYIICASISVLCTIAVPIFFMISGALILKKDYSFRDILRKIMRILIVLLFISFFYYFAKTIKFNFNEFNLFEFLSIVYSSKIVIPLWYLYAYISFLVISPFLRILTKYMDNNHYKYLLFLGIVFGVGRGIIAALSGQWSNDDFSILFLQSTAYYPILGYYIENILSIKNTNKKQIPMLFLFLFISVLCSIIFNYNQIQKGNPLDQSFLSTFNYINAPIVYFLVKYILENTFDFQNHVILRKIISFGGECTFGIYLLEDALRSKVYWRLQSQFLVIMNEMLSSLLAVICCVVVGIFIVSILKKIPYLKKLL